MSRIALTPNAADQHLDIQDSHPLPGVEDFILVALVRGSVALLDGLGAAVLVGHVGKGSPKYEYPFVVQ